MDPKELERRLADLLKRVEEAEEANDLDTLNALSDEMEKLQADYKTYNEAVAKAAEQRKAIAEMKLARPEPTQTRVGNDDVENRQDEDEREQRTTVETMADDFVQLAAKHGMNARLEANNVEIRALITGTTIAPIRRPDRLPLVNAVEDRSLRLADIITTIPVSDSGFEYPRDNTSSPQGAAAETAQGSAKPETTYTFELISDSTKTIAHWTDIARQALRDGPQMQGYLRDRLFYGLGYRVDGQIINGAGTGANLKGILTYTTINDYDVGSGNTEAKVESLRRAKTLTQVDEFVATTAVLNPFDWETIELSRGDDNHWRVSSDPTAVLPGRIWGMTVVESNAIAAGTGLIGDFRLGAALMDRQQATLYVTDSDGDKFKQNIITLLAEVDLGLALFRPAAFAKVTFRGTE